MSLPITWTYLLYNGWKNTLKFIRNTLPTVTLTISDADFEICAGYNVIYTGKGAISYQLYKNDTAWLAKFTNTISSAGVKTTSKLNVVCATAVGKTKNNSAIISACSSGKLEIVKLLLFNTPNRGINPSTQRNNAIIFACLYGHVDVVKLLLNTPDRGIDPAAQDNDAIIYACENGHIEVVKLLLNTPGFEIDQNLLYVMKEITEQNGHTELLNFLQLLII